MCSCVWCYGTHLNASWHTYDWVMANMRGSDCKHINESWHTCMEWDQHIKDESWHTWMSHGPHEWVMAHINESWHTCMEWDQHKKDVRRFQMCHGTQIKVSWHSDDWVMANNWMEYGLLELNQISTKKTWVVLNALWHTYMCAVVHEWLSHVKLVNESWHTIEWVMSHAYWIR